MNTYTIENRSICWVSVGYPVNNYTKQVNMFGKSRLSCEHLQKTDQYVWVSVDYPVHIYTKQTDMFG